jgi:archaemetzincin
MQVGVLAVGIISPEVLELIATGLQRIYPDTTAQVLKDPLILPQSVFDKRRNQYNSTQILQKMREYARKKSKDYKILLGVSDFDIYATGLNYVFGEAFTPGGVALISLWRLKPSFYGADDDLSLYHARILKEAVHEVGHALGLVHCPHSYCVMHFSNSVFDTDKKQSLLCDQHSLQASIAITNFGNRP